MFRYTLWHPISCKHEELLPGFSNVQDAPVSPSLTACLFPRAPAPAPRPMVPRPPSTPPPVQSTTAQESEQDWDWGSQGWGWSSNDNWQPQEWRAPEQEEPVDLTGDEPTQHCPTAPRWSNLRINAPPPHVRPNAQGRYPCQTCGDGWCARPDPCQQHKHHHCARCHQEWRECGVKGGGKGCDGNRKDRKGPY